MVSFVESSADTRRTLLYNEQKLTEGKALFLGAFNYWQEDAELGFEDKFRRLHDLTVLNERVRKHTIHFSLNFHPGDRITDNQMRRIAGEFLRQIDFGDQPALVYRHLDAGHPHAHVVTVKVRRDGSGIENDKRSPRHMTRVCAELERRHGLTPALAAPVVQRQPIMTLLEYGKAPTSTGIAGILDYVLDNFAYTSIEELNAVLSKSNVLADRGSKQGLMHRDRGLYYRMTDERGYKVGAPIKASAFQRRPTLDWLEKKFVANQLTKQEHIGRVRTWIDWSLYGDSPSSLDNWKESLLQDNIRVVTLRTPIPRHLRNAPGSPARFEGHGFYYIDYTHNTVYRDTDLGPGYTAAAILHRSGLDTTLQSLALGRQLPLTPKDLSLLQKPDPDPAQKLGVLLKISPQQDHLEAIREAEQQELHPARGQRLQF
jgi:hypothetical protein